MKILDSHTMCSAERAPKFFGWDKYLDELYQVPQGILKHHCFAVFEQRPTTIVMKRSDVCEYHVEVDVKLSANKVNDEQREKLLSEMPNETKAPGIRLIKRVGLHKNYKKIVPDDYKDDELYKSVDEDEMETYKDDKRKRNSERAQAKRKRQHGMEDN